MGSVFVPILINVGACVLCTKVRMVLGFSCAEVWGLVKTSGLFCFYAGSLSDSCWRNKTTFFSAEGSWVYSFGKTSL